MPIEGMSRFQGGEMVLDSTTTVDLPEPRRKELFRLLVVAQDYAMTVPEARKMLCDLFGLMEAQVLRIEREGLDGKWPPL
jgi:hypothetical protein